MRLATPRKRHATPRHANANANAIAIAIAIATHAAALARLFVTANQSHPLGSNASPPVTEVSFLF